MSDISKALTEITLEQSLHEATDTELCYFMAKILEEMTKRAK